MSNGLSPLGAFIFGTLAEFYGIRLAIFTAGVCAMTSVALLITFFPAIRTYKTGPVIEELELPAPVLVKS